MSTNNRYTPLVQLTLARFREFYREPAAVFWVYGFPLIMTVALGLAFRERPVEKISINVREDAGSPAAVAALKERLATEEQFDVRGFTGDDWARPLRTGKTDLVIAATADGGFELWDEPSRKESVLARHAVESALYRQANPTGP